MAAAYDGFILSKTPLPCQFTKVPIFSRSEYGSFIHHATTKQELSRSTVPVYKYWNGGDFKSSLLFFPIYLCLLGRFLFLLADGLAEQNADLIQEKHRDRNQNL